MSGVQDVNTDSQNDERMNNTPNVMSLDLALAQVKFYANQIWKSTARPSTFADTEDELHGVHEHVWFQSQRKRGRIESISARDILTGVRFGESIKENDKTGDEDLISPQTCAVPSKRIGDSSPTPEKRPRLSPKDNKERGKVFQDEGGTRRVRFCDESSETETTESPERKPAVSSPKRKSCLKVTDTPPCRSNKTCTKEWFLASAVKDFVQRRLRLMVDPDDEIYDLNENPAFVDLSPYTQCHSPKIQSAYWEAVRTIKPHRKKHGDTGSPVKYNNPFDPRLDFKGCVPSPMELAARRLKDSPRNAYEIKENLFLATSSYVSEMLEQHTSKYRLYRFALTKTKPEILSKLGFSNKQNQEKSTEDCKQQTEADMLSLVYIPEEAAVDEDTRNIFDKIMDESIKLLWVISPRRRRQRPRKDTGDNALADMPLNKQSPGPIKRPQALTWDMHEDGRDMFDEEVIICDLESLLNSSSNHIRGSKQDHETVPQMETENNTAKPVFDTNREEKAIRVAPENKSMKPNNVNCNTIRRRLWEDNNATHDDSNLFVKDDGMQVRTSTPKHSLSDQDSNSSNSLDYSFDSNFERSLDFENLPSKPMGSPELSPDDNQGKPPHDGLAIDAKEEANANVLKKFENLQYFPSIHSPCTENGLPIITTTATTSQSGTTSYPTVQVGEQIPPMRMKSGNPTRFQPYPPGYINQENVSAGNFNYCRPVPGPNIIHGGQSCVPPMASMANYQVPQAMPGPQHDQAYLVRTGCHISNTPTTNTNLVFSTLPPVRYNHPISGFTRNAPSGNMPGPGTEHSNLPPQQPPNLPPYPQPVPNMRSYPPPPLHQFENKPINPHLPLSNFHPNIPPPQAPPPAPVGPMPSMRMQWHPAPGLIARPPYSGQNMPPCYGQGLLAVPPEPRLTEVTANLDPVKYSAHLQTMLNAFILTANQTEVNVCHTSDMPLEVLNDLGRQRITGPIGKVQLSHLAPEFKPFK